jgi:sugar lactone lactonase YvrE
MTLGKPGGAAPPEYFSVPGAVIVDRAGNIFVGDGGHAGAFKESRILKFDKTGKLIQTIGKPGSAPGEFNQVHALAFDKRGRLFVADRGNNRLQIFDRDGKFVAAWTQFGRPSAVFVDQNDVLYVADDESTPKNNPGFNRGMRIGSAVDGAVKYYIPPPSDADGLAVDKNGVIYGAEVNQGIVQRYVRKSS